MSFQRYNSRFEAGTKLVDFLRNKNENLYDLIQESPSNFFCFAIPNGGVSVVEGFCSQLMLKYDILIVRKIKIPYNTEAGFGSITTDGTILFNQPLLSQLNLSKKSIEDSVELTKREIQERLMLYNKDTNLKEFYSQNISNKHIFILDDGLASGFTMLAAIDMIQSYKPKKIFVAVPTAPLRTIQKVKNKVDMIYCPNIRDVMWFAVADAYKKWYDVSESEVVEIINHSSYYVSSVK